MGILRPLVRQHAHDFGDDVAGTAHDDGVANAHVLAPDFILVMKGSVGNGDAAHEHRLEPRHRGQRAGPPHLNANGDDFGRHLLGWKLVGDGESRRA